ncbi:hypothetical protein GQ55_3G255600 [Panicum hallii var. hallii]|uniref:Uncharacterized protein n=1 Tax=Panicum hallii var. hallii TaxID=1504633 RepID=A0A2T7EDB1_9POAL|nr:hypothetical protein GQ55_3G255600 [Panicum hallii var. hallii]
MPLGRGASVRVIGPRRQQEGERGDGHGGEGGAGSAARTRRRELRGHKELLGTPPWPPPPLSSNCLHSSRRLHRARATGTSMASRRRKSTRREHRAQTPPPDLSWKRPPPCFSRRGGALRRRGSLAEGAGASPPWEPGMRGKGGAEFGERRPAARKEGPVSRTAMPSPTPSSSTA